jgi:hypothetical protein
MKPSEGFFMNFSQFVSMQIPNKILKIFNKSSKLLIIKENRNFH